MRAAGLAILFAAILGNGAVAAASGERSDASSMSLRKTACYGNCASYKVTIFSDGRGVFEAGEGDSPQDIATDEDFSETVAVGRHEFWIPERDAQALLAQFRAAKLFSMNDRYDSRIVDAQATALGFSDRGNSKEIWDNQGSKVGMPALVTELQAEVYRLSGVNRLVTGKAGLVPILIAEKFDFHTPKAGRMVVRAIARSADAETIKGLLDQGVSLRPEWDGKSVGEWAVQAAVYYRDQASLTLLADRGELRRLPASSRHAIAKNAPLCELDWMRTLKAGGIDPIAAEKSGGFAVLRNAARCRPEQLSKLFIHYLEQGADPNAADEEGETAIFDTSHGTVLNLLLQRGADVNHLNKEGQSAVFSTWDEDVIVRLLNAGTKPVGKYYSSDFWEYATAKKWTKVIAWLEAHPDMKAIAQGN